MFNISKQDIRNTKQLLLFWRLVDKFCRFWELQIFTFSVFLGHRVPFIVWRCLVNESLKRWAAKHRIWKATIDRSTFRVSNTVIGSCFISTLSNNFLTDIWCCISKSVNHVIDQGSNMYHGISCSFKIFDLNWHGRTCCKVLIRLSNFAPWFRYMARFFLVSTAAMISLFLIGIGAYGKSARLWQ